MHFKLWNGVGVVQSSSNYEILEIVNIHTFIIFWKMNGSTKITTLNYLPLPTADNSPFFLMVFELCDVKKGVVSVSSNTVFGVTSALHRVAIYLLSSSLLDFH